MTTKTGNSKASPALITHRVKTALAALGLIGLTTGYNAAISLDSQANAQALPSSTPTVTPSPTLPPTAAPPTVAATNTPEATATLWPTPTAWPTPKPWTPPARQPLPTLVPLAIAPASRTAVMGGIPVGYSPPDGADTFGGTILRWEYFGELAPDEFFDIKIKPFGSQNSVFVDWTRSKEYALTPWNGWAPGLYTWQIGIVKGYREGETKHFIADTGRDSQPFVIKWQASGGGGGSSGGGAPAGGGGGGGGSGGS